MAISRPHTSVKVADVAKLLQLNNEEKRSERRKHCAPAVVRQSQKFSPRRRPPSRWRGTVKI